ncbi:MAG: ATP synthase F0 subunit B [Verrucomicrobiota bacterium]
MNGLFFANIVGDTAREFGVDWPHLIAQMISFSVVAFCLHRFAYKPILTTLADRKQRIAESLQNADKIKQELAKAEASRQEVLTQANTAANKMIEEARLQAAKVLEAETQKAIATANQIIVKAREANDVELARLKLELRREMVRLVAQTTAAVTSKILTAEDQQRLVEETNKQLAA